MSDLHYLNVTSRVLLLALVLFAVFVTPALATDDHLLLCEAVVTPTDGEFIEIFNPTGAPIVLTDVYLSDDEDYALLPGAFGTGPAPAIGSFDFIARFPAGAEIPPAGVVVVAFDGAGFITTFGSPADYEIVGTDAGTPDMLEAYTGSIGSTRGLTNSGENAVLFSWDGASDLVADVDMLNIGTPSSSNDIGDKTGISVDGPDGDTSASMYLADAFTMPQQAADPGFGFATHRILLEAGNEASGGGNGLTGDDETSEQITATWDGPVFPAPDPGVCNAGSPSEAELVINEIDYDQPGTDDAEFIEIFNAGGASANLGGLALQLVNGSGGGASVYQTIFLPSISLAAGEYFVVCASAATVAACDLEAISSIQNGAPDAVALLPATEGIIEVVDTVSYEGDTGVPYTEGSGSGLADTGAVRTGISRYPNGVDTDLNNVDLSERCITPGAENVAENTNCVPPTLPTLVINEIDYDQPGGDAAEFIEILNVGPDPVDLDPIALKLVNGSGGGASVYQTIDLPAVSLGAGQYFVVCANAANTLGCNLDVSPDTNLIQNGAPDAAALVQGTDILDTVSYEGDVAGYTEGSGSGLEDSGVTGNDFSGISRFPDGVDTDINNVDLSPRCITPGAPNVSDSSGCTEPTLPQLVVNEIDYDQSGTDLWEFIEIYNAGGTPVDLDPFALKLVNGSNGSIYNTIDLPATILGPGGYYVVCGDPAEVVGCDFDASPDSNLIQNGAPDAVALVLADVILDTVSYEGDVPGYTEGSGSGLEDNSGIDFGGISRFPDGTDTDVNNVDLIPACITPGGPNLGIAVACEEPVHSPLVVNEIDYDQPSGDTAEFVEIKNVTGSPIDLGAYSLELVNGSGGGTVVYQTIALPSVSLAGGDFFVVCANAATVANCDLDAISSIQNGSPDAVALVLGGVPIDNYVMVADTVSYEGDTGTPYTEGSGTGLEDSGAGGEDNKGISRLPDGADSNQNNVDLAFSCITPGVPNTSLTTNCGSVGPVFEIWEIQGNGLTSPYDGVGLSSADNVVTGVGTDGFYMQTPVARTDGDPETSDGIFVFTGGAPTVAVGDLVTVAGLIDEFFDNTEFTGNPVVTVTGMDAPLPPPVVFDATTPSPNQPQPDTEVERYEGMLVSFVGVASGPSDRFGDTVVVAKPDRVFRETGVEFPGIGGGIPVWDGNPEVFDVDADGLGGPDTPIFAGQAVTAEGPLHYAFGDYQVRPTALTLGPPPPLPRPVRPRGPGEFTVASLNMFRFFDDVDDPGIGEPVPTPAEFQVRLDKFSLYVREVMGAPDILATQEVENLNSLERLAAQIATDDPTLSYSAWLIEGNDVGGIDVGYLTRDDTITVSSVEQFGEDLILTFDGSLLNDRPPLVLEAEFFAGSTEETFPLTVVNVHQRSLSGIEGSEALRVKTKRFEQSTTLADYLQSRQAADPDIHLVLTGDFNAFQFTDGYVHNLGILSGDPGPDPSEFATPDLIDPNLTNQMLTLDPAEQYSFNFGGSAQILDHALTSVALSPKVSGVEYPRANSDAPDSFGTDPGSALRVSDHDGLVLYMNAGADLSISKIDDPDPAVAGEIVVYTITVDNAGPAVAEDVVVTDTLPVGVTFLATVGCAGDPNGWPTCNLGDIPAGGSASYELYGFIDPSVLGTITNQATVTSATSDPDPANNVVSEDTQVVGSADLTITKTDTPDPVYAGFNLSYEIFVFNLGPSDAVDVTVNDILPVAVNFKNTTGCLEDPAGAPVCSLGTIPAGTSATYTLVVKVPAGVGGTLVNTATVTSGTADPNTVNNTATEDTTAIADADLELVKSDVFDPRMAGELQTYQLQVTNHGPAVAAGVMLEELLPAEGFFVSVEPEAPTCMEAGGLITCELPNLSVGETFEARFDILVEPEFAGVLTNSGSTWHGATDPNPANNDASEDTDILPLVDLVALADVNGNGSSDAAVLQSGSLQYAVLDGLTGNVISSADFQPDFQPIAMSWMPSFAGTDAEELVILARRDDGAVGIFVRDSRSAAPLRFWDLSSDYRPLYLATVPSFGGTSSWEIAVLTLRLSDGMPRVFVLDASSGALLKAFNYPSAYFPLALEVVPDFTGNAAAELAVPGRRGTDRAVLTTFKDAATGATASQWFNAHTFLPMAAGSVGDWDGTGERFALLARRSNDGAVRVFVRRADTGAKETLYGHPGAWLPMDLEIVPDFSGSTSTEGSVLRWRPADGDTRATVKDLATGAFIAGSVFDPDFVPLDMEIQPDWSATSAGEQAVLGIRMLDGQLRILLKDAQGVNLGFVDVP